jgi:hypothetical protein
VVDAAADVVGLVAEEPHAAIAAALTLAPSAASTSRRRSFLKPRLLI